MLNQSENDAPKVTIIGGCALDVIGQVQTAKFADCIDNSNIGSIEMRVGGSARNAAECLGRLTNVEDMQFISALGELDHKTKGQMIVQSLEDVGIKDAGQKFCVKPQMRTACFSGVLDAEGNFKLGIADMEVLEELEEDFLKNFKIHESQIVVMDGNLSPTTI